MKNSLLITILLCCLAHCTSAQTPVIDSLRKELVKEKADSIKVHDRIRISWYLIQLKDSVTAWKYIHEADSIAGKTKNPVLKGIVYEHTAIYIAGKLQKSHYLLSAGGKHFKKIPELPGGKKKYGFAWFKYWH